MACSSVVKLTGYDWDFDFIVQKNGAAEDVSSATEMTARVVAYNSLCQDGTDTQVIVPEVTVTEGPNSDWANGLVYILFPRTSTASVNPTEHPTAYLELSITIGGVLKPVERPSFLIQEGNPSA